MAGTMPEPLLRTIPTILIRESAFSLVFDLELSHPSLILSDKICLLLKLSETFLAVCSRPASKR